MDYYIWCDNGQVGFIIADDLTKEEAERLVRLWNDGSNIRYTVCNHEDDRRAK